MPKPLGKHSLKPLLQTRAPNLNAPEAEDTARLFHHTRNFSKTWSGSELRRARSQIPVRTLKTPVSDLEQTASHRAKSVSFQLPELGEVYPLRHVDCPPYPRFPRPGMKIDVGGLQALDQFGLHSAGPQYYPLCDHEGDINKWNRQDQYRHSPATMGPSLTGMMKPADGRGGGGGFVDVPIQRRHQPSAPSTLGKHFIKGHEMADPNLTCRIGPKHDVPPPNLWNKPFSIPQPKTPSGFWR